MKCQDCVEFRKLFDGKNTGGGKKCPSDTTEGRKTVYALDETCDKFTEAQV